MLDQIIRRPPLIALVCGLASALLYVSGLSGGGLSFPLFLIAPLPIVFMTLGWGIQLGLISVVAASIALVFFSFGMSIAFACSVGAAAVYFSRLIALSQDDESSGKKIWFPLGDALVRMASIGGVVIGVAFLIFGYDPSQVLIAITPYTDPFLKEIETSMGFDAVESFENALRLAVYALPFSVGLTWFASHALSLLWGCQLANKVQIFERARPRMRLVKLPFFALPLFIGAVAFSFSGPPIYVLGAALAGTFGLLYCLIGYATMHIITTGMPFRTGVLWFIYASTLLFGIPVFAMLLLGLADHLFDLRRKYIEAKRDLFSNLRT